MSFLTCFWLFPQKEHFSRSPPSPNFATSISCTPCPRPPPRRPVASAAGAVAVAVDPRGGRHRGQLPVRDDLVDHPVLLGFRRRHDEVAIGVLADLLLFLAGVVREQAVEGLTHAHDLLRLDLD